MRQFKTKAAVLLTFLLLLTVFSCWAKDTYKYIIAHSMLSDKKVVFTGKHPATGWKATQENKRVRHIQGASFKNHITAREGNN